MLYYTILHYTILYYRIYSLLYFTILYYTPLYYTLCNQVPILVIKEVFTVPKVNFTLIISQVVVIVLCRGRLWIQIEFSYLVVMV